ncbi:MAG TPA: chromate efflux transporter, partial [Burkholderiales bacterium]|nr:chromate efflux transporter [Burkholderiales bacterium]
GPASSKVGIALGASRAGITGALAAWLGFTLPSALILIAFGYGLDLLGPETLQAGWLHGLKIAAVAVVAQAVWSMGRQLCPDRTRASFAIVAALLALSWHSALAQIAVIVAGAVAGRLLLAGAALPSSGSLDFRIGRRLGWTAWLLFFALLVLLPLLARLSGSHAVALFDSFYRAGSLVFGGGHVVLPMLRAEVVPAGWVGDDEFLAGYGVAQAVPGPLFTFAAYLGTVARGVPSGWAGGLLTLVAIFLPAFFLALGPLPFWSAWREHPAIRASLAGVNAAVVGILLAALYDPIFTTSVRSPLEFALALAAFGLLFFWRLSPFWVVALAAAGGELIAVLR